MRTSATWKIFRQRAKQARLTSPKATCTRNSGSPHFPDSTASYHSLSIHNERQAANVCFFGSAGDWRKMSEEGQLEEALEAMDKMDQQGIRVTTQMLYCLLQGCIKNKDLAAGRRLHSAIRRKGFESNVYLGSALIQAFAASGNLRESYLVFRNFQEPSLQIWQSIISAHVNHGQSAQAIELYGEMKQAGVLPNHHIYVAVLKACSSLVALTVGRQVHADIVQSGFGSHLYVGTTLIDMYGKAGDLYEARKVFDKLPRTDVVLWNSMIQGYARNDAGQEAIEFFQFMQQEGIAPNSVTYLSILRACSSIAALEQGRLAHADLVQSGLDSDLSIGNTLVDMYAKCKSMDEAFAAFQRLTKRDIVSWNSLIRGFAHNMRIPEALQLFQQMQEEDVEPDLITLVCILKACGSIEALDHGMLIHCRLRERRLEVDVIIGNNLVDMYAKCGSLDAAQEVFGKMSQRDALSWKAIIGACLQNGQELEALEHFRQMLQDGVQPDKVIFAGLLKACSSLAALDQGKQIHNLIIQSGLEVDPIIGNTLVDMYGNFNRLDEARKIFDQLHDKTVISWTALLGGYALHGQGQKAIELFQQMQQEGVKPNARTFVNVLKACASIGALQEGKNFHAQLMKYGYESNEFVKNILVDMYVQCGGMDDAHKVFDRMSKRDVISWSVMIGGYAERGHGVKALELYKQMRQDDLEPSKLTFLSILKACGTLPALDQGKIIHAQLMENGLASDVVIANTLIDMYANCGSLTEARDVFDKLQERTVVSWTAMIGAYASHGCAQEALCVFEEMQHDGFKPDEVTLLCVLCACSHAGLVDEGYRLFGCMFEQFGVSPGMKQYACMVDLLCRAGHLLEAEELINEMPVKPEANVWMAVLGACQTHGNLELGIRAFKCIMELEPNNAGAYILMGNLYAAAGLWEDKAETLSKMVTSGLQKEPGCTWIEVNNEMQPFVADDTHHPQRKQAYDALAKLKGDLRAVLRGNHPA